MKARTRNLAMAMLFAGRRSGGSPTILCACIHIAGGDGLYLATLGVDALGIGNFIGEFVGPSRSRNVWRA